MEELSYEIIATSAGRGAADRLGALIAADPLLSQASAPWRGGELPPSATLYLALVVLSDDLSGDAELTRRLKRLAQQGFPLLPVVERLGAYHFESLRDSPLSALAVMNALGLDQPQRILEALRHHGALWSGGSGGRVFISYARADGSELAQAIVEALKRAGFRGVIDTMEIIGGENFQDKIHQEVQSADLLLLVDSRGAARSFWVDEELDYARAAHVQVLAVTPSAHAFQHALLAPHVPWDEGATITGVAQAACAAARRLLARKISFQERVHRVLARMNTLHDLKLNRELSRWILRPGGARELQVTCCPEPPAQEAVTHLRERVGEGHGLLIGGTRPYPSATRRSYQRLGGDQVVVTPLSRVASKLPAHSHALPLRGRRILLCAAMSDPHDAGLAATTLAPFIVTFVQTMVELGVTVVFGGHPTITPLVHKAILELDAPDAQNGVELHQGERWADDLPPAAHDRRVFKKICWHKRGRDIQEDLALLRSGMINDAPRLDGAVFVGGKTASMHGDKPGILDEYARFREAFPDKPPLVLGLAGGAARELLRRGEPPPQLVDPRARQELDWTIDPDVATALIVAELLD